MKTGDIVFVRGNDILSRAVRFFDKGQFSHVALAISETHIVEAQYGTKVRIVPMNYTDVEIVNIPMSGGQQELLVRSAIEHCGEMYDLIAIFYFVLAGKLPALRPNHLICSELVTSILTDAGRWTGRETLTPNELYRRVTS